MNQIKTKKLFKNVMGLGDIDYEFTINLSELEAKQYKFDISQIKSLKDCKNLLEINAVKDKIIISSKNNLINLLLFINKTNISKSFTEFLSINCLFLSQDLAFIKERIKSDFDENFLFLIESNILSPCKFKLNINVENKESKSFELEMTESSKLANESKNNETDKNIDKKNEGKKEDVKNNEEIKKTELSKESKDGKKLEEIKKVDDKKPEEVKKTDISKDVKKEEIKKTEEIKKVEEIKKTETTKKVDDAKKPDETKKLDNSKDEKKPDEVKKPGDEKKPEISKDAKKPDEAKKPGDEKKPEISKDEPKKPKQGNDNFQNNKLSLPQIQKPEYEILTSQVGVEGNDSKNTFSHLNLLNKIVYDFKTCDFIFIDLNKFLNFQEISLNNLFEFLHEKIVHQYFNTKIVFIFPGIFANFDKEKIIPLFDLISLADIVIYDKRDAVKITHLLGYKPDDKNFEVRFMFLKELKRKKYKQQRMALFLDDFNKLIVINQEIESNLIVSHNEFNFEIGFKLDYFKTVTNNYEFLKYVFLGGFFSKVVEECSVEDSFYVGKQAFMKVLEILQNNLALPDDPEYFVIKKVEKKNVLKVNVFEQREKLKSSRKYDKIEQSNTNQSRLKSSKSNAGYSDYNKMENMMEIEQKKLDSILLANQNLQVKLNRLLSMSNLGIQQNQSNENNFNPSKSMTLNRKLPGLNNINEKEQYSKIANYNKYSKNPAKNELKPISNKSYNRLLGNNYQPFENTNSRNNLDMMNSQSLTQDDVRNQMHILNNQNNLKMSQPLTNNNISKPDLVQEKTKKNENILETPSNQNKKKPQKEQNLQLFIDQMQENYNLLMKKQTNGVSPPKSSFPQDNKSFTKNTERHKRELFPVCNLGYVPKVESQQEMMEKQMILKKKYKDPHFFDKNHNKNRFKYLEKQKLENGDENNRSFEEKGQRNDYDDLNRSMEKEKKRIQREEEKKAKIQKEKELEDREKERKEKEKKDEKDKKDKKPEEKKIDDKKPEEKKVEAKK